MNAKIVTTTLALGLAISLLWATPAAQPVTSVTFQSRDLAEQETMQGQMHFRPQVLRIDGQQETASGPSSMIFRGDRELLWFLQHDEMKYVEMDKATIERMSSQISGLMAQMQEQLKNLSPEQQEAVTRMMKGRLPNIDQAPATPLEIRSSGETEEISGYSCRRYDVYRDGERIIEVWATDRSNIPGAENLSIVFEQLSDFYQSLTEGFAQFETDFNFNVMAELDGFPIRMLNYENGLLQSEMLIQEIRQGSGSPDLFDVPRDYKRQSMGMN